MILPTGIATDNTGRFFFGDAVERRAIRTYHLNPGGTGWMAERRAAERGKPREAGKV
jgi:hypothetical protein